MAEISLTLAEANERLADTPIITGRPNRGTFKHSFDHMVNKLRSIPNWQTLENGWAGLVEPPAVQLLNGPEFIPPVNPGPITFPDDVTRGQQATLAAAHALNVSRYTTYCNLNDAIRTTWERCIQPAYRPEAIGPAATATWPQNWTALQIVEALQRRYQKVSPAEKAKAKRDFLNPHDQNQPIELLFSRHENLQQLMTMAEEGYSTEQLIGNVVDLLRECPSYSRAIERWDALPEDERNTWQDCKQFFVDAYEEILARPPSARNAYANLAAGQSDDEASLADSMVELGTAFHSFGEAVNSNNEQLNDNLSAMAESLGNITQQMAALSMNQQTMNQQRGPPYGATQYAVPPATYVAPPAAQAPPPYAAPPPYTAPTYPPPTAPAQQRGGRRGGRRNGRNQQSNANQSAIQPYQAPSAPTGAIPPYQPPAGQEQQRGRRNNQLNYYKYHNNWYVCYSCGFDVDHESHQCQNRKPTHRDDFTRQNFQEFANQKWPFCRKGMHKKYLPAPR